MLFNGNEALKVGVATVKANHKEDYWEILPLTLKATPKGTTMPGMSKNPNFEKAEEKAVKAVQMHSMNLQGKEQNSQISEAYLLLGKARYYDQRYVPAIEAFNYTIRYYNDKEKVAEAKLWREKTNLALDNEDVAIENLNILLSEKGLDKKLHQNLATTLAEGYIKTKAYDKALSAIDTAIVYTKNKPFLARLNYIKGQLWQKLAQKDSAQGAFDQVIALKRKGDWALYVHALIEKELLVNDSVQALATYDKLIKNRENKPFLGRLYYEKAMLALRADKGEAAETLFTQAIDEAKGNKKLQAKAYEQLADYYFNTAQYTKSGKFYEKALPFIDKKTKKYRLLKKRFDNLDDVIKYEAIARKNDSILKLTTMSKTELKTYFEDYIAKLKAADVVNKETQAQVNEAAAALASNNASVANNGFYFYNQTAVSFGKETFKKQWGDRILEDYWRYADKALNSKTVTAEQEGAKAVSEADKYDVKKYLGTVPTDNEAIAAVKAKRDFAYYQLGLIYKEQFKEYKLAVSKLEDVLSFKPEDRLVLPAKYNLFKLYGLLENTNKATAYKEDIVSNYPSSQYAKIIQNPDALLNDTVHNPDTLFVATTKLFLAKKFDQALAQADANAKAFFGTSQALRFELLKAKILGRTAGLAAFKKATAFIALNHPKSKEGKEAQELLDGLIKTLESSDFTKNPNEKHWKIIYETKRDDSSSSQIAAIVDRAKQAVGRNSLKTSTDYYLKDASFVVVHGFKSEKEAREFAKYMDGNGYSISNKKHIISSTDYALVQIKKNINSYK